MPLLDVADQESIVLRFKLGDRVVCQCGTWQPGTIVKMFYVQRNFPPGKCAPYQVKLDDGRLIYAPADADNVVREFAGSEFDVDDVFDDAEIPDEEKLAVTIVTGFLGAGKTTLVNYILNEQHGKKICVIENEFGAVNIDQALVAENISSAEELISMDNGCACCTVRGDLVKQLVSLKERRKEFDAVLLETTGLADPAPILQTFDSNPVLQNNYRIDCVATLVDCKFIQGQLDEVRPEGTVNEAVQQVAFADRVLLNKVDLISPEELRAVKDTVRARTLGPRADTTPPAAPAAPSSRAPGALTALPTLLRPLRSSRSTRTLSRSSPSDRVHPWTASSTRARTRSIVSTRCWASTRRRWRRRGMR